MKTGNVLLGGVLVAIVAANFLVPKTALASSTNYDGLWSVVVMTEKGTCDRSFRYPLRIERGRVQGDGLISVKGSVGSSGGISVWISGGDKTATGTGRMRSRDTGAGTWRMTSGGTCSGRWNARRVGE